MSIKTGRDLYDAEHPRRDRDSDREGAKKTEGKRPGSGVQRGRDLHTSRGGVEYDA